MLLSVVGIATGAIWILIGIAEDGRNSISYLWIPVILLIIGVGGAYKIVTDDPVRVANGDGVIEVEYAKVINLNINTIKLDNRVWKTHTQNAVSQKYPINLEGINEGDIVRSETISTDFGDYLIKIEKVK
jgi:hypothetical protein